MARVPSAKATRKPLVPTGSDPSSVAGGSKEVANRSSSAPRNRSSSAKPPARIGAGETTHRAESSSQSSLANRSSSAPRKRPSSAKPAAKIGAGKTTHRADSSSQSSVVNLPPRPQRKPSKSPSASTTVSPSVASTISPVVVTGEGHVSQVNDASVGDIEIGKTTTAADQAAHWRNEVALLQKENQRLHRKVAAGESLTTKVDDLIGHFEEQEEELRDNRSNEISDLRAELARLQGELSSLSDKTCPRCACELREAISPRAVASYDLAALNWGRIAIAVASCANLKDLSTPRKHCRKDIRNREAREAQSSLSGVRTSGAATPTTPRDQTSNASFSPRSSVPLHSTEDLQDTRIDSQSREEKIIQNFSTLVVSIIGAMYESTFKSVAWNASNRCREIHASVGTYRIAEAVAEIVGQWSRFVVLADRSASIDLCMTLLHRVVARRLKAPSLLGHWLRLVLRSDLLDNARFSIDLLRRGSCSQFLELSVMADANDALRDFHWARLVTVSSTTAMREDLRCCVTNIAKMKTCIEHWARLAMRIEIAEIRRTRLSLLFEMIEVISLSSEASTHIASAMG